MSGFPTDVTNVASGQGWVLTSLGLGFGVDPSPTDATSALDRYNSFLQETCTPQRVVVVETPKEPWSFEFSCRLVEDYRYAKSSIYRTAN